MLIRIWIVECTFFSVQGWRECLLPAINECLDWRNKTRGYLSVYSIKHFKWRLSL